MNAPTINLQDIFVINIIESGSGFAERADNGEQVFIPASVVNGARLQIGEHVSAVLVPNMNELKAKTPWRAVRVPRDGVELPPLPERLTGHDPVSGESLDLKCLKIIQRGGYYTTRDVADELNVDMKMTGNALQRQFNAGKISRAEVHHRVGQSRPSFILWAQNSDEFVEDQDQEPDLEF